jgi:hypothetical protein
MRSLACSSSHQAKLAGGGSRSVSRNTTLVLDASASSDPDNAAESLSFAWSCLTSGGDMCYSTDTQLPLTFTDAPLIGLSTLTLLPGTYVFSVVVSKGSRTAQALSSTVFIASAPVPNVELGFFPRVINPTDTLVLTSTSGSTNGGFNSALTYEWSVLDHPGMMFFFVIGLQLSQLS